MITFTRLSKAAIGWIASGQAANVCFTGDVDCGYLPGRQIKTAQVEKFYEYGKSFLI